FFFFFSSRRRHTRFSRDWSSDVCSSDLLKTFLRRHDYEVEVAEDGEEALPMIDGFGPDFVITDVRMPRVGGMDLLAALEAKGSRSEERRVGKECRSGWSPGQWRIWLQRK